MGGMLTVQAQTGLKPQGVASSKASQLELVRLHQSLCQLHCIVVGDGDLKAILACVPAPQQMAWNLIFGRTFAVAWEFHPLHASMQ